MTAPTMTTLTLRELTPTLYKKMTRFERWNADRWHRFCLRTNDQDPRHRGEPPLVTAKRGYLLGIGAAAGETGALAFVGVSLVSVGNADSSSGLLIAGSVVLAVQCAFLTLFALKIRQVIIFFRQTGI